MANNIKEFTVKINGIDVAIKNTSDLNKVITTLETNLKDNQYGADKLKEFQKTLDTVKIKGAELQKELAKKAGFNVTIEGVPQFVSTIKQLEDAKEELDERLKNTDVGTAQYAQLTAELQRVNTQLEVFEQSVEQVTIEKKIGAATAVLGSVSSGFATASAGAAVFGKQLGFDAEKVKEYSEQADSLIAFLLGIKGVTEGITGENLKNIKSIFSTVAARKAETAATVEGTAATEGATLASKLFGTTAKAALASTGIGLLVVGLVLVYENFDRISSAAQTFGDYIKPLIAFAVTGFNNLKDSIRNAASALTGGLIDDAATQKKQDTASDTLDKLKEEEDYQRKALDLQSKGELDRLKKTADFEKRKLQLMKDSGDASEKEIKLQQQKIQEAEKASADAQLKFKEDVARKEIDLTSKTEGEKLRRVRDLEAQKLADLKRSVGTENELYQQQLLIVREANKAIADASKAKATERAAQELELKKQLIEINSKTETEKQKALLALQLQELEKVKKAHGEKSFEYRKFYADSLAQFKAYATALEAEQEKLQTISTRDSINNTNAKIDRNSKLLPGEKPEAVSNVDKFNVQLQQDIAKVQAPPVVVPIQLAPAPLPLPGIRQRVSDAIISVEEQLRSGQIPQINFFDAVFGEGFTEGLAVASDTLLSMSKETKVAELDAQLALLDEMDARIDERLTSAQEKLDTINQQLNESNSQVDELDNARKAAQGSEKDDIIKKLEIERAKRNQLAAEKRKEDDRVKKAQQEQAANEAKRIQLEQERQKELDKTNKIMSITKAINDAINAGLAIQAAVKAIAGANSVPFPGNLAAIAIALAATVSAIASAKAIKFEAGGMVPTRNGIAVGPSHRQGGIPFSVAGSPGYEMEGGEHITNKIATSKNFEALDTINKYGAQMKFKVVPVKGYYESGGVVGNFTMIKSSLAETSASAAVDKKFNSMQVTFSMALERMQELTTRTYTVGVDQIADEQTRVNAIQTKGLNN